MSSYMSPPPTPPVAAAQLPSSPVSPTAGFRLPQQPTILLKAPSEETVARLKQLAPYYWSHPQTTNCAIHFPIDPRQQARIQAYQAKQRQGSIASAAGSRSRQGSVTNDVRRASHTPPASTSSSPYNSVSRQSSSHRLRAVHSGSGLSARASILGSSESLAPTSGEGSFSGRRRGSITPGYDPFSRGGTSIVVQPTSPLPPISSLVPPSDRRESAPLQARAYPPHLHANVFESTRRGSAPVVPAKNVTPMRTVRLHVEYLTAQSELIRQVLAEAAGYKPVPGPTNLMTPESSAATSPTSPSFPGSTSKQLATPPPELRQRAEDSLPSPPETPNPFPHSFFRFSPHRYPRVVQPPAHAQQQPGQGGPVIILPVPDPVSFPLLIHYMYHGKMDAIERTLREGQVSWEGLVRNVEYLGLREDVKRYLGRWWKNWRDSEARNGGSRTVDEDDDEDESVGRAYPYPTSKDVKMEVDTEADVGEWTANASASVISGELVDEMAGLLGRF